MADIINPLPFGWINYNIGLDAYTAYNNPTGFGVTYATEINNIVEYKRTYYSFDTSGIGASAIIDSASLRIYIKGVTSPVIPPGGAITFRLNAKAGNDFIGAAVSTDDWGGSSNDNITNYGSSPPALGNQDLTIATSCINKTGDTDIELMDACQMSGMPAGSAVNWSFNTKVKAGTTYYVFLSVEYHLPSGYSFVTVIGAC